MPGTIRATLAALALAGASTVQGAEPIPIAFIDPPIANFDATGFQLVSYTPDVTDQNGRTILLSVAAVDSESNSGAVSLKDNRGHRIILPLNLDHPEVL